MHEPRVVVRATRFLENEAAPLRVLCVPHAAGSASALAAECVAAIHATQLQLEVWGLDWTWHSTSDDEGNQAPKDAQQRADAWVNAARRELSGQFFDKPFVMVGHSVGALAAVALVRHLDSKNFALPMHVFVSGAACPAEARVFDEEATLRADDTLLALLESWNGTPEEILTDEQSRSIVIDKLREDLRLHNSLVATLTAPASQQLPPRVDLSVYGGSQDVTVPVNALDGWGRWVDNQEDAFDLQVLAGDHFFVTSSGRAAFHSALTARLATLIARNAVESTALIKQWNSKKAPYPADKCLHDLFTDAVKRSPDAIAMYYEGKTLTFAEVDRQSELLADYLFHLGVRPNRISGIFMEHSIEFVIAYIAALKAGGAYMPLEIVYPPELLSRVLEESQPTVILTKSTFRNRLPDWQTAFCMDRDWLDSLQNLQIPPMPIDRVRTHPDDLAYVVMSSGTTGVPKGICCPHRGAVHSYDWRLVNCPFTPNDRVASHVFFVWELLRPMLGNKPLYIIPDDTIYDPVKLVAYIHQHTITRILFTPSLLQLALDTVAESELLDALKSLRLVWLCGEVVTIELRDRFVRLFPACELQNLYSVSECHDVSAIDLAHMNEFGNALSVKYASCGQVMPNVSAYVLDDDFNPVTVGVTGELYIGGPCLAIGYLNRPQQTAQRFLKNVVPGETVYKTGDRARFLPNGHLQLIGRCDFMVKIRGYSVVLGAVEAALAQHPLVSTAVVLTEGDEGHDKRLVAYIVPDNWDKFPSAATLREFLKEKLPHYAIPSVFVQLDALPINSASGKLDRKKIPSVEVATKLLNESFDITVAADNLPQSDTEKRLAEIWVDLLRLEVNHLSRTTSFFDVGGHSLLATRLVSSIRDAFDVHLTLADILVAPELNAIAGRIDAAREHRVIDQQTKVVLPLEAALDSSIYPAATRKAGYSRYRVEMVSKRPRNILLTGCTGFLGAHLLHSLLKDTNATVYCLVRASSSESALERARQALNKFDLLDEHLRDDFEERVVAIPGDLSQPLLGVGEDVFKTLASEIDAILHNGAEVNLVKPYSALKGPNVLGTQEVLRLAVTNGLAKTRVKSVHYISTNGVFSTASNEIVLKETADLRESWENLENGYAQSKWVAEHMCHEAASRGLPVSIMRPGNMAPSSKTGKWNTDDFMYLLLKGCWEVGSVPDRADWFFDMTPVDFAAKTIVHFAALYPVHCLGQTLHIQNPSPPVPATRFFDVFVQAAAKACSKKLQTIAFKEWQAQLSAGPEHTKTTDLERLTAGMDAFDVYLKSRKVFDCAVARQLLEGTAISCPHVGSELMQTYLRTFSSNHTS
ncbi:TPA: hypothetical protein N0F65_006743 [Lagenidium giganteum]|uniref:Carrier domain-containing protein n=1 Tax=Lagenidium giganteum TaxID=4803 RepID=A0AAV2YYQ3_9STRA|nr:TPA: hypothetical protein N0F65_006743 [Lagenidium giganteum]